MSSTTWFTVPPSEILDAPAAEGYHYEWVPDERARAATVEEHAERKCRRPRCDGKPVMAFQRPRWGDSGVTRHWWLYCAEHMYGRRIEGGVVQCRHLVADEDAA